MCALAALDWLVMATYGAVVLGIGWFANRGQRDSEDYFLGGRRLRWWMVGVSLIATSFSSVSLIGGTQFGFTTGMQWLQLQIGDLVALVVVCALFLPLFCSLQLTTAYEYLERRFGVVARTIASALFLGQTLLRTAVLVYAPATALATILSWEVETAILVTAAAAILYSAFGGISAVVWTDLIQLAVIVFAVIYGLVLIVGEVPGGFDAVLDHARRSGRLHVVVPAADRGSLFSLLGALVPYAIFAVSLFGTGQQAVQRFLSCRDLRSARRAALTGWLAGTMTLGITLFLGVCLAAWVALAPGAPPLEADRVLPAFIQTRLPAGVAGLMLAAIFAASMSSIDSAIHSMSTAFLVDFWRRFSKRQPNRRKELLVARFTTVAFGVLAVFGALYAAERQTTILETLVTWLGYFAGPLLGLFVLGLLTRRTNELGAVVGVGVAIAGVVCTVTTQGAKPWGFHPLWLAVFSFATTLFVGRLASQFVRPAPPFTPSRPSGRDG